MRGEFPEELRRRGRADDEVPEPAGATAEQHQVLGVNGIGPMFVPEDPVMRGPLDVGQRDLPHGPAVDPHPHMAGIHGEGHAPEDGVH